MHSRHTDIAVVGVGGIRFLSAKETVASPHIFVDLNDE